MSLRAALALVACTALVAACSSSSGSNSDASAVYGPHARHSSSGAAGASGRSGTQAHSAGASSSKAGGGGGHPVNPSLSSGFGGTSGTTRPPGGGTTTPAPGGGPSSNCVQSYSAGAHITVCPGKGLHDGMQVKVTGDHFHATYAGKPEGLLVMECHYKGENANDYGPNDCTINILNLAPNSTTVRPDGTFGPFLLTVHVRFKSVNCAAVQCMVTAAQPIQSGSADNPHALISF